MLSLDYFIFDHNGQDMEKQPFQMSLVCKKSRIHAWSSKVQACERVREWRCEQAHTNKDEDVYMNNLEPEAGVKDTNNSAYLLICYESAVCARFFISHCFIHCFFMVQIQILKVCLGQTQIYPINYIRPNYVEIFSSAILNQLEGTCVCNGLYSI